MKPAQFDRNTITITSDDNGTICKASGSVIKFDGFLRVMKDTKKDDDEDILPKMNKGPVNIEDFIRWTTFYTTTTKILRSKFS